MTDQPSERTEWGGPAPRFLDLRRVHQFVTAVEAPNLRIAATQLFMTQQGLSASLRQLESDLGVDLFSRSVEHFCQITRAANCTVVPRHFSPAVSRPSKRCTARSRKRPDRS